MTREEARKAAEAMMAYADGKEIEFKSNGLSRWEEVKDPIFNWYCGEYRIKKEPTYRPFKNKEECWEEMQKHQPFGWRKEIESGELRSAAIISDDILYTQEFKKFTFADGTPFGIKEDE